MRRFDWWEDLRVRHEALVTAFCVRLSAEDRRSGETREEVLSFKEALARDLPRELFELLADPERDPDLARVRAEQRGWLLSWRAVPEEEGLLQVRPRHVTPLGLGKLAALRTDGAMLSSATMPMQLMGVVPVELPRPMHFATSGFAQRGHFVLEQNGKVFVLNERGQVLVHTFDVPGPWRWTPLTLDGATVVLEGEDPEPEDRHPELLKLLGERFRVRLDFAEGFVGRA